jgi:SPP1 family predicted phage head-tail adaptor
MEEVLMAMYSPQLSPAPAGVRNDLVTVQRLKIQPPDAGGHIDESNPANWETFTKQWCSVNPRGSREFFRREQVAADITHQVEMLFNSESNRITTKMRIMFKGRRLNIAEPPRNIDENNHSLVFACVEVKEGQ